MTIYARIQKLCKRDKITVTKLEKTFGKSRGFYQKWTYAMPNTANLIEVADFFNVSIDFLLGRPDRTGAYEDDQAFIDAKISEDLDLKEAIEKYYTLSEEKKKHVIELINLL